ncbi:hypothetical protein V3C99_016224, partial [Haemonchus contortus]
VHIKTTIFQPALNLEERASSEALEVRHSLDFLEDSHLCYLNHRTGSGQFHSEHRTMYRPPEDIQELRAKGLPWLVATCLVVILVLAGILFYYVSAETIAETLYATPTTAFFNYQVEPTVQESFSIEHVEYDTREGTTEPLSTGKVPLEWPQTPRCASRTFPHAAVSSRNEYCAEIGRDVLIRGGNAVDAAIATVICEGGLRAHATGFGGGMVMLLHDRNKNETLVISAYSAAPRTATEETFVTNPALAEIGYSSIATPGFLHGLWKAFKRYGSGRVAWQDLLIPTVHLLERGTPASGDFVDAIKSRHNEILSEKSMNSAYKLTITEGEIFRDLYHAAFLRRLAIARDPVELFYRGEIANQIVLEMKQRGGLLTKVDLASYETNIEKPMEVRLSNGYTLKGPQPPSSFTALSLLVDIMMSRFWSESNVTMDVSYLRELLKAQQLALSRLEELGDLEYMLNDPVTQVLRAPQNSTSYDASHEEKIADIRSLMWNLKDQGSVGSHINVVDGGGLAVALSSSLNERFGSVRRSVKGGFVWNNEMSSFTIPDKEKSEDIHVNAVEGRKRPRSTMMPLMVFDEAGQLVTSIGITGSLNSILAAAQVLLNNVLLKKDMASSLSSPRVFAISDGATFEIGLPMKLLSELRDEFSLNPLLTYDSTIHCMKLYGNRSVECICDFRGDSDVCGKGF